MVQQLGQVLQLCAAKAHALAGRHVRAQLRLHAGHRRQRAHRRQFTALPVQVVALEDVTEQMRLQVLVDDGAKSMTGPVTGAPEIRVWLAVPTARSASPTGTSPVGGCPGAVAIPCASRARSTLINSPKALRLFGNPA